MSVYSTPSLRVGVYRCPPGNALWHETNDNIGERPHVVFPGLWWGSCAAVRAWSLRPTTSCSIARSRPTSARCATSAATSRCSSPPPPSSSTLPAPPVGRVDAPTFLLACRLARRLRDDADGLLVEETATELVGRAIGAPAPQSGRRPATRRERAELAENAKDLLVARLAQPLSLRDARGGAVRVAVSPHACLPRVHRPDADGLPARPAPAGRRRAPRRRPRCAACRRSPPTSATARRRISPIASARPSASRRRNCAISWKRRRPTARRTAACSSTPRPSRPRWRSLLPPPRTRASRNR